MARKSAQDKDELPIRWTGIDNVHDSRDDVFQLRKTREGVSPVAATQATDVDFDDDGMPATRHGITNQVDLPGVQGAWSTSFGTYVQSFGELHHRDGQSTTLVVSRLRRRVALAEHWGQVYFTDGTSHYRLVDATTAHALSLPVPTIDATTVRHGQLEAGRRLVAVSFVDALGNEHGLSDIHSVPEGTAFEIRVGGATPDVARINVYVSPPNQEDLTFHSSYATPYPRITIASEPTTLADPPRTDEFLPMPDGLTGLVSHLGFLMGWRGNVMFRAENLGQHLWHAESIFQLPGDITAAASVSDGRFDGLWVGTSVGLFYVTGAGATDDPTNWTPKRMSEAPVLEGVGILQGAAVTGTTEASARVAMFATEKGLVLAQAQAKAELKTERRFEFEPDKRASFALSRGLRGYRQIAVVLT